MAMFSIPCGKSVDSTYRVELEGQVYDFRIRWNTYSEAWMCYIGVTGEDPVVSFMLSVGQNLLLPFNYMENVPKGFLYVRDMVKNYGRIDKDNFGQNKRFRLVYLTTDATDEEKEVVSLS